MRMQGYLLEPLLVVLKEICWHLSKNIRVTLVVSKGKITPHAQQPTNTPSNMVVIHAQPYGFLLTE